MEKRSRRFGKTKSIKEDTKRVFSPWDHTHEYDRLFTALAASTSRGWRRAPYQRACASAACGVLSSIYLPSLLALGGVLEDLVEVREHCARVVEQPRRDERVREELPRDDGGEVRIALAQCSEVLDDRVLGVDLETLLGQ